LLIIGILWAGRFEGRGEQPDLTRDTTCWIQFAKTAANAVTVSTQPTTRDDRARTRAKREEDKLENILNSLAKVLKLCGRTIGSETNND
jgi:hypothetical protein